MLGLQPGKFINYEMLLFRIHYKWAEIQFSHVIEYAKVSLILAQLFVLDNCVVKFVNLF